MEGGRSKSGLMGRRSSLGRGRGKSREEEGGEEGVAGGGERKRGELKER